MNSREQWLDISKGFAIFLVVIGHVLIGFLTANMYPQLSDPIRYIACTLYSFHMPLFFAISGFLYGRYEKRSILEQYQSVALKKLIRLGIPFVLFSLLQGLVHIAMNGHTNHPFNPSNLITMVYAPFDQFWFLYALLAIFLMVPLLEIVTLNDGLIFCFLVALKFVPSIFNLHIQLPFFEWFMAYALYFYAGTLIARHAQDVLTNPKLITLGALIYIPFNYLYYSHSPLNWELGNPGLMTSIAASVGLAYTGILFALFIVQRIIMPLAWPKAFFHTLGTYSFEIYLLHTLPSVAIRIILEKVFHIHDLGFHLILAVAFGILIPVLIGKWVSQYNGFDLMFFPGKYLKLTSPKKIKLEGQTLSIG